jgi:hypothetical protein
MMLSDLGTRCDLACHLPDNAVEIEVSDPLDEERRYAYMVWTRSPAPNSTRYVEYDPARNQVETEHYRMRFSRGFPIDFALQQHLHEERPNMIRGFEVRAQSRFLWAFSIRIENRDVRNDVLAYKAGPIRIIRRVRHTVRLGFGLHSPGVVSNDTFYRNLIALPFTRRTPIAPKPPPMIASPSGALPAANPTPAPASAPAPAPPISLLLPLALAPSAISRHAAKSAS